MKLTSTFTIALSLALSVASCSSNGSRESLTPATDLSHDIDKAIAAGRFDEAMSLIDSLNSTYADSLDLRRATIAQRARATEGLLIAAIQHADSALADARMRVDSLSRLFVAVKVSDRISPYYIYNRIKGAGTSVQPRVGDDDMPWMIIIDGVQGHHSLPMALYDSRGNRIASGSVSMPPVITPEEADTIAAVLTRSNSQSPYKLTVGDRSLQLSPNMAEAIVASRDYAVARRELTDALISREGLERRLITARTQSATGAPAESPSRDSQSNMSR